MALNTDLLKKLARRWVGQIGAGGVADAVVTTIPLSSATNLPTDTAVVAVIDRVDANGTATASLEESVIGVVSGSNLVTCTRGVEGTAQAHSAGAVVEILITAKGINDLIDGILVQHNQLGLHTNITTSNVSASAVVTTDTVSEYTAAAGVTLDGVKLKDSQPYCDVINEKTAASGVTVDGLLIKDGGLGGNVDGWILANETWTYASASTITVPAGAASKYQINDKIKWTQTTVKYGVLTAVADTLLTIAVNTDYVVTDAAISANFYSKVENPQGFPHWFAYTPTGPTNTTLTGRFSVHGRIVSCRINGVLTGTPAFTNMPTLPITASTNMSGAGQTFQAIGVGGYLDAGTTNGMGGIFPQVRASATTCNLIATDWAGANATEVTATSPITWVSTDEWWVWFSYEF